MDGKNCLLNAKTLRGRLTCLVIVLNLCASLIKSFFLYYFYKPVILEHVKCSEPLKYQYNCDHLLSEFNYFVYDHISKKYQHQPDR